MRAENICGVVVAVVGMCERDTYPTCGDLDPTGDCRTVLSNSAGGDNSHERADRIPGRRDGYLERITGEPDG